jgi:hypothetical protein
MLKGSLDGHTFLDWKWGLPQANFWLPGWRVFSFGDELSTWKLVVVVLMDLWKIIGMAVSLGTAGPTTFSPGTHVPLRKHPTQKICRGEVRSYH